MSAEDPSGKPLKLSLGAWEGRDAMISEPLMEPGIYALHDPGEPKPIYYGVAVSPAESALAPLNDGEMARQFETRPAIFHSAEQEAAALDPNRRLSLELWKWFVVAAVALMFVEAWLTRRETSLAAGRVPA
jgi:hypothetical protein